MLTGAESVVTAAAVTPVQATIHDLVELVALDTLCFGERAWSRGAWREAVLKAGWTTLVVRSRGLLAGAMVLLASPPVASLASLAVHPEHRQTGLGRTLLREAVRRARSARAHWLLLEVDADNSDAVRLYRREGFAVIRRFREQGRARLEMARRLGGRHAG